MTGKQSDKEKHDLREKSGPGTAIDTEKRHSVLDRDKKPDPDDSEDVTRPWPSHSTVPEGQTNKGGA